ncbi:MAG: hypothetical protein QXT14_02665 [Candidatus Bathyarchaeia archaeon]
MSTGAVKVPFTLELEWLAGECELLHETGTYYLPPGLDVTLRWAPEEDDKVFLIFALTFGKPRNYATGEVVYTDEVGFWHRGMGMKLHWDPLVESINNITYPHVTPATKENPFEIRFVNRTDMTICMDVSVWYFEFTRERFEAMRRFVRGFLNLFRFFGRFRTAEEAVEALRGLAR